ncbi:MAG: hypothetical protein AB8H79_04020 [Myxococcota bacterium]
MPSFLFRVALPHLSYHRWWFTVSGQEDRSHGPYPTEQLAMDARFLLFRKWAGRAKHLGGDALRLRDDEWLVTLPPTVPCAGLPFRGEAVAQASAVAPRPQQPTSADIPTGQSDPPIA